YVLGAAIDGGEPLFIVLNGADETVDITGPEWPSVGRWQCLLDTANGQSNSATLELGGHWAAQPRSVLAFAGTPWEPEPGERLISRRRSIWKVANVPRSPAFAGDLLQSDKY